MGQARGTILIVEDEPGFRRIYRDLLEREGYTVMEADDGEKGLHAIQFEKPDLVLLDVVLPSINGFEILKKVRSEAATKDVPIIIFSVLGDKDTIKKGLETGADDFAVKGFYTPGEILSKIRALLYKSDAHKHIVTYRLAVHEGRADAPKLETDMGMTKLLNCSHCNGSLLLEMIPDFSRTDGHWFHAHFVCAECKTAY